MPLLPLLLPPPDNTTGGDPALDCDRPLPELILSLGLCSPAVMHIQAYLTPPPQQWAVALPLALTYTLTVHTRVPGSDPNILAETLTTPPSAAPLSACDLALAPLSPDLILNPTIPDLPFLPGCGPPRLPRILDLALHRSLGG